MNAETETYICDVCKKEFPKDERFLQWEQKVIQAKEECPGIEILPLCEQCYINNLMRWYGF